MGGTASGYTSTIRSYQSPNNCYVGYTIYETTESDFNSSGIDSRNDTLRNEALNDDYYFAFPTYIYTESTPVKIYFNLFTNCAEYNSKAASLPFNKGISTYYGSYPKTCTGYTATNTGTDTFGFRYLDCDGTNHATYLSSGSSPTNICVQGHYPEIIQGTGTFSSLGDCTSGFTPISIYHSGITLNVTDTGWIKYNTSTGTTYQQITSLGTYTVPDCADCSTITVGIPFVDLASFTITNCGNSC